MSKLVPIMLTINGACGSLIGYYGVSTIDYFLLVRYLKIHYMCRPSR